MSWQTYSFGVYAIEALLLGKDDEPTRLVCVRASSTADAIQQALALASRTDRRAKVSHAGAIVYPHGVAAGVCWALLVEPDL